MNRYLRYTLLGLMWAAVAAYIIWAGASARRVRTGKKVAGVEIEVVDSSSQGHLVSAAMVRGWISHSGIKTLGEAVDAVQQVMLDHGFDIHRPYIEDDGKHRTVHDYERAGDC